MTQTTPWPIKPHPDDYCLDESGDRERYLEAVDTYHRARAEAALSRLRVAVEAFNTLEKMGWIASFTEKREVWRKALATIGDLPPHDKETT